MPEAVAIKKPLWFYRNHSCPKQSVCRLLTCSGTPWVHILSPSELRLWLRSWAHSWHTSPALPSRQLMKCPS